MTEEELRREFEAARRLNPSNVALPTPAQLADPTYRAGFRPGEVYYKLGEGGSGNEWSNEFGGRRASSSWYEKPVDVFSDWGQEIIDAARLKSPRELVERTLGRGDVPSVEPIGKGEGGGGGHGIRGTLSPSDTQAQVRDLLLNSVSRYYLQPPSLERYRAQDAKVPLPEGYRELERLSRDIVSGEEGRFREQLSGEPNYEDLETLFNISRRNLRERTLPEIADVYSGVGAFQSGGRRAEQERALTAQQETELQMLVAERQWAQQMAAQAVQQIPIFQGIEAGVLENNILNKNREIETHFRNQGLSQAEFNMALQQVQSALNEAGLAVNMSQFDTSAALQEGQLALGNRQLDTQIDMYNQQMELQRQQLEQAQDASLWGLLGGGLGAIGGGMIGGLPGAMIGFQGGMGLGQTFGGAPTIGVPQIANTIARSPLDYYLWSQLGFGNPTSGFGQTTLGQPFGSDVYQQPGTDAYRLGAFTPAPPILPELV